MKPRSPPDPRERLMNNPMNRRRKKLSKPKLQVSLIGKFVGVAALAMLLQLLFMGYLIVKAAKGIEGPGGNLVAELPTMIFGVVGFSFLVLLPVMFGIGVLLTHHIAGPIYRFETYLRALTRGEVQGPCSIRDGDELVELCEAINSATEPLWRNERIEDPAPMRAAG